MAIALEHPDVTVGALVEAGDWPSRDDLMALSGAVVAAAKAALPVFPRASELSVVFTDDRHIALLNANWRGKPSPTNVLSFPASAPSNGGTVKLLGDIVLAYETGVREAELAGLTLTDHISHLLVHGLLHLLGYDHEDDGEAAEMESLEAAILARLGIEDPYADHIAERIQDAGRGS